MQQLARLFNWQWQITQQQQNNKMNCCVFISKWLYEHAILLGYKKITYPFFWFILRPSRLINVERHTIGWFGSNDLRHLEQGICRCVSLRKLLRRDWGKPYETVFRITSIWVVIWKMLSEGPSLSKTMLVIHRSHWYFWRQGIRSRLATSGKVIS